MRKKSKRYKQRSKNKMQNKQAPRKKSLVRFSLAWQTIVVVSVLLSIFVSYYVLQSKVLIYTDETLNPGNPFATPFILKNESLFPIYDIEYEFYLRDISAQNTPKQLSKFSTSLSRAPIKLLEPGETYSMFVVMPFRFTSEITYGDIDVIVSFRPKFLWWREDKIIRFTTKRDFEKNLRWLTDEKIINE